MIVMQNGVEVHRPHRFQTNTSLVDIGIARIARSSGVILRIQVVLLDRVCDECRNYL